jgi:carboxypeptidase PM20D1
LDNRTQKYADTFASLIRMDTTSYDGQTDKTVFYQFHKLLKENFPHIFAAAEYEDFSGSFLLKWKGKGGKAPIMLMNHHDVVVAAGEWRFPPFSAEIAMASSTEGSATSGTAWRSSGSMPTQMMPEGDWVIPSA